MELSKQSDLSTASFTALLKKPKKTGAGLNVLVGMISCKIKEETVITKEDITILYYSIYDKKEGLHRRRSSWAWNPRTKIDSNDHRYCFVTLNDSYKDIERMAIQWFKSNLGAAIIQGKLLVIPVIEID